jgi:hypothetical protein
VELLLAEIGAEPAKDLLLRLHFDGAFQFQNGGVMVAASQTEPEAEAKAWLAKALNEKTERGVAVDLLLQAWWCLKENKPWGEAMPNEADRQAGWRVATKERMVEIGWLARKTSRLAQYEALTLGQVGL